MPDLLVQNATDDAATTASTATAAAGGTQKWCVLNELIRTHLQPEILDEENKWTCGGCGAKVRANKTQEYVQLPKLLMMHLKRFRYDAVSVNE